ncbi:MAG: hypothetical protein JXR21_01055 [Candidatus Marinimicrobia bacterium]|nr:hypothetical protein [Candidatus Neomarinimicrobiota bacterium]
MKKVLVVGLIAVLAVSFAFSQTALGLRGGNFSGISLRTLNNSGNGMEFLLTANKNGFELAGLFEKHKGISDVEDLSWFWGLGLHGGLSATSTTSVTVSAGVDAILGIEYSFLSLLGVPLSLSIDYKPAFDIIGGWGTDWFGLAGTIRYTF